MAIQRNEIQEKYKWDTTDLMASQEEYEQKVKRFEEKAQLVEGYKGKLSDKDKLLEFFKLSDELNVLGSNIFSYAMLKSDEDQGNSEAQARKAGFMSKYVKMSEKMAFADVEITALDSEYLSQLSKLPEFAPYDRELLQAIENKKHILSEKEEVLLAGLGEIFNGFSEIFTLTDNADIKFQDVDTAEGKQPLNHANYSLYLSSEDRKVREDAYNKMYAEYKNNINHITATYVNSVRKDCYLARVKKYGSALEAALKHEEVNKEVYDTLLKNISENCSVMHEYVSFRKQLLSLEDIRFYDLYVAAIKGAELKLEYEDALELVSKALTPLGKEYGEVLKGAFENRWIDVFYSEGKRSGAYSAGTHSCHPYVLLNYEKTTHDVFTIAHEMGHAMHSYNSSKTQPPSKSNYKIFVAEVASTVNEVLLLRHLIDNTQDVEFKKYCLNYFLDMIRTTIFRQTMFAEFEAKAHEMCESGESMTKDSLSEVYENLNKKYYGNEIIHDDNIKHEWCRIPHFYRSFYVYKYATGLISAIKIAYDILEKGQSAVDKYMEFLKSGCSDTPVNLLRIAGVDLESSEPFTNAMNIFSSTLKELKNLCK